MTVINGNTLLRMAPIKEMATHKMKVHGVSYGLSEAGYDIRIKQEIMFVMIHGLWQIYVDGIRQEDYGKFTIASAIEEFQMPGNLVGVVHDKSTWARLGLSVFNTVIEPGFKGGLTLELVFHGSGELIIPAGAGIAQVIFSKLEEDASYDGKYQNQIMEPQPTIFEPNS